MAFSPSHPDFAEAARYFGFRPNGLADIGALRMTPERRAARRSTLNCSELPILASGDPERINMLARVKWGEVDDPDLDRLNVEAGQWMEPLILTWLEEQIGVTVSRRGEICRGRRRPFLSCTLDGFTDYEGEPYVVQTKFYHPSMRLEHAALERAPQVLGEAYCAGAAGTLLVIYNNAEALHVVRIPADPAPQAELLTRSDEFWAAVEKRRLPFLPTTTVIMPKALPVPRIGEASMADDPAWRAHAAAWRTAGEAATRNEQALEALKALVPQDEVRVVGGGIEADRDARGSVRVRPAPKVVDKSTDNTWVDHAQTWLGTRDAVAAKDAAAAALKGLLPPGKKAVFGEGVKVGISVKGVLSVTSHALSAPVAPAADKAA